MTENTPVQIFGDFQDELSGSNEYLTIHFSPSANPRKQRWNNYGLSADFLGDYFANFFPGDEVPGNAIGKKETVKAAVTFIANELIENAMKYSDEALNAPISISLYLYETQLIFVTTNLSDRSRADRYQAFIQELMTSDIDEMYTRQLEKTAMGEGGSYMGLLTMINDYSAKLAWKFKSSGEYPGAIDITVMTQLDIE